MSFRRKAAIFRRRGVETINRGFQRAKRAWEGGWSLLLIASLNRAPLDTLDNNRRRHPTCRTHGDQRIAPALSLEFIERRAHQN